MKPLWKWCRVALLVGALAFALNSRAVASMFGEENATLVQILAETLKMTQELKDLNDAASATAGIVGDLKDTYDKVNAGIDELQNYSFDSFVDDFRDDLYRTYPGFAQLEGATQTLKHWDDTTHAQTPFRAYEAITAVVGDMTAPLRDDVHAGRANIDKTLILKGEAAGALALASNAEEATRDFDKETADLTEFAQTASPGQAQQVSARAMLLVAAQNSHIIRLLSRSVRLDGVDKAFDAAARIQMHNAAYQHQYDFAPVAADSVRAPDMFSVEDLE
jgi:hypothetical protein